MNLPLLCHKWRTGRDHRRRHPWSGWKRNSCIVYWTVLSTIWHPVCSMHPRYQVCTSSLLLNRRSDDGTIIPDCTVQVPEATYHATTIQLYRTRYAGILLSFLYSVLEYQYSNTPHWSGVLEYCYSVFKRIL